MTKEEKSAYDKRHYAEIRDIKKAQVAAYRATHRDKIKADLALYYMTHKTESLAYKQQHRMANRERYRERGTTYRMSHLEELKAYHADYCVRNKDKFQVYHARRRARMDTVRNDLTTEQWAERVAEFNGHCAYCGKLMYVVTQDHMTPLVRGGEHTLSNVVPCCKSCNSKKGTWTLLEVAAGRRIFPATYVRQQEYDK